QPAVTAVVAVHRGAVQPTDAQRRDLGERFRAGWLPLPGQVLELPADTRGTLLTATLQLNERDGQVRTWSPTGDFTFHGPDEPVFVVDRAAGTLTFGDGRTGRIPVLPAGDTEPIAAIGWEVGGGSAGNGGLTGNWRAADGTPVTAENLVAAEGGQDPETPAQARERGVAGMLATVRRGLADARMLGTQVIVREPRYRATRLRVTVATLPADPAQTRRGLDSALRRFLDPLMGGDQGDGWPLGEPLRPSALLR